MKIIDTETAIIGGGASGLAAAIAASRYGCGNVTVLEKNAEGREKNTFNR